MDEKYYTRVTYSPEAEARISELKRELTALRLRAEQAEARCKRLEEFVREFIDAWDNGMGGDSYLYRNASQALEDK